MGVSETTPRRVLRRATELGVHADCVAADFDGACQSCIDIFSDVFREMYGHAQDASEALMFIIQDIQEDRRND